MKFLKRLGLFVGACGVTFAILFGSGSVHAVGATPCDPNIAVCPI